ncbi:YceI family protein [Mangrovimonas yunxiaonensis]|nr:YceI family protein [Mangrovimonas yunxiaonensis]
MKIFFSLVCFLALQLVCSAQEIVSKDSKVEFKIKGGGLFNIKGTFTGMQGDFSFNPENLNQSSFDICIAPSTVDTGNKKRDAHLKDPDFFEVETYPNICFKSTRIAKTMKGYTTVGLLTMHGITKTVSIPFTFKNNTFKGQFTINRFDYNIGQDFGTLRVGEEANVTITCVVN